MSWRQRDSIVDEKCVGSLVGDVVCRRLGEDLSSIEYRMVLKSLPIMCGRCGCWSSQADSSPKNCLPGLLGAYMFETTRSIVPI